ncbi:EthD family reductase [Sphingobium sp.]|uniref:EthD family reductase n=1 Tax=Sphingobium sp. TaxID=1912891 RepID=UPI0028BDBBFC|nr:EthD family reductase [Sphingobium sp.]
MQKFVVMYPRQPDMEAFKAYYVEKHIPLARKIPGLQALRYSFDPQTLAGEAQFACIFEGDFADAQALGAGMSSPEGERVAADVVNFARVPPLIVHYSIAEEAG